MKVAVTSKAFAKNPALVAYLAQHFPDHRLNHASRKLTDDELVAFLQDADAVILALEALNEAVLAQLPQLKVVAKFGVGLDNIDFAACARYQVPVLHRAGVNRDAVAELSLCLMLMLLRNIYLTSGLLAHGEWLKQGGQSLFGKTVGLIGFGHVGTALAQLLQPFNCRLLVTDVLDKKQECQQFGATQVSLPELLQQSTVVSLHCPLSSDTAGMVNTEFLAAMRPDAVLINTARGELVDLNALKQALQAQQIAGAGIDVYDQEPPTDLALLALPNLIPTPHIGGNSAEATLAMGQSAINLLVDFYKKNQSLTS